MGRLRATSLVLVALAAGLLLAACGGGGNGELLPGTTADQITSNLDQVRASVAEGDCEGAEAAVAEVSTEVDGLKKVDARLKKALEEGALKLSQVVSNCGAQEEAEAEREAQEAEEQEQEQLEAEQQEEEAFEKEQKAEEREEKEKAQEEAEKQAEQPGPPEQGEEFPPGKAKGHEKQEETVEPPSEEEVTPSGGPAGGIGPGAKVEGGGSG